mmetsp:Transcript_27532/g.24405  ORF Transcript_27532/g.24405 Transcript_27532/m.24405 type:complete len:106 (-) Transcript_27532:89-406(-)
MIKDKDSILNSIETLKQHFLDTFINNVKTLTLELTSQNFKVKQEENYKSNNEESKIPRVAITLTSHDVEGVSELEIVETSNIKKELEGEEFYYPDYNHELWKTWQ